MTLWYLKEKKKLVLEFEKSMTFLFTCIGTARGGEELGETILIFAGPVKDRKNDILVTVMTNGMKLGSQ